MNEERQRQLDAQLTEHGVREPYREPVAWLRCFKGIDTVTVVGPVAELHDFRRFHSARQLMSYVGLVPSRTPPASVSVGTRSPKPATGKSAGC